MGRARTIVLIAAAVLVVGGLLAAVVRVNDEREQVAAQLAAVERRESEEQALRDEAGRLRRDLADLLEENDQLYRYIGKLARDAGPAAPAACPEEVRGLLRPYFRDLYFRFRITGEDQFLPSEVSFFVRLCG